MPEDDDDLMADALTTYRHDVDVTQHTLAPDEAATLLRLMRAATTEPGLGPQRWHLEWRGGPMCEVSFTSRFACSHHRIQQAIAAIAAGDPLGEAYLWCTSPICGHPTLELALAHARTLLPWWPSVAVVSGKCPTTRDDEDGDVVVVEWTP